MHNDMEKIIFSEEQLQARIQELGKEINRDYADKYPLVVCLLKGAFIFMADLIKRITVPLELDFIAISSYGTSAGSSGVVRLIKDLEVSVEGKDVLIVEDIVDTGLTLNYLIKMLQGRRANTIHVVTLFDKPARRIVKVEADYRGFLVPDEFIVGYGLDYAGKYRNLPYIGILKREIYSTET